MLIQDGLGPQKKNETTGGFLGRMLLLCPTNIARALKT